MVGNEHWRRIATRPDAEVREEILSGYLQGKPFTPYVPTIEMPPSPTRVLDFGCGLGRSFSYLVSMATEVVGFDLPEMIDHCARAGTTEPTVVLRDDWPALREERFDLVFASLVLQHIDPTEARSYLDDFARMTETVYLLTRGRQDFGGATGALIDRHIWEIGAIAVVEHDQREHSLHRIGWLDASEIAEVDDDRHLEMVLSRRESA
jgi:cyclopropane fatty-acyl-phospholipid synthase-like methyltransferase